MQLQNAFNFSNPNPDPYIDFSMFTSYAKSRVRVGAGFSTTHSSHLRKEEQAMKIASYLFKFTTQLEICTKGRGQDEPLPVYNWLCKKSVLRLKYIFPETQFFAKLLTSKMVSIPNNLRISLKIWQNLQIPFFLGCKRSQKIHDKQSTRGYSSRASPKPWELFSKM